jgi:hypothetical protein
VLVVCGLCERAFGRTRRLLSTAGAPEDDIELDAETEALLKDYLKELGEVTTHTRAPRPAHLSLQILPAPQFDQASARHLKQMDKIESRLPLFIKRHGKLQKVATMPVVTRQNVSHASSPLRAVHRGGVGEGGRGPHVH